MRSQAFADEEDAEGAEQDADAPFQLGLGHPLQRLAQPGAGNEHDRNRRQGADERWRRSAGAGRDRADDDDNLDAFQQDTIERDKSPGQSGSPTGGSGASSSCSRVLTYSASEEERARRPASRNVAPPFQADEQKQHADRDLKRL
jgi:hypothetical protein